MKEYSIDEQIKQLETQIAVIKMHVNSSCFIYSTSQVNEIINERHRLKIELRDLHVLKIRQDKVLKIVNKMKSKC